jgi:predicted ATP-binding protein involved in virulence
MDMKTKLVDITATAPIFESFNGKKISINQLSSGEKQLFCQAAYLQKLNLQDSIILIDEPETSLHPTWQRNILKLYQNIGENNQIIVATHSPHIIASVKPESLFVLYPNSETGKIEPINMAKAHKHTKGVEPNRILQEVMGMDDLRDPETTAQIKEVAELLRLHPEQVELPENQAKIEKLREDLGKGDPFIMLLEYQLLLIKRRKLSQ